MLLKDKAKAPEKMIHLCKKSQVEKDTVIVRIRSDHGREFENTKLATFYNDQGTHQKFSSPKTPQQNGIVEWKNRVVQEMARVMLRNKKLPKSLWGEAVNTTCHTLNRVYFKPDSKKTLMNSGEERNRLLSISGYLVVIVTFYVIESI